MDTMLAGRLAQPMMLVAADASGGWLHDSEMLNQVGGPQVETYLTRTVVQTVDARFRTIADRSGRAELPYSLAFASEHLARSRPGMSRGPAPAGPIALGLWR